MAFAAIPAVGIGLHVKFITMLPFQMTSMGRWLRTAALSATGVFACVFLMLAQQPAPVLPGNPSAQQTPAVITLDAAIARARATEPTYAAAVASAQNAKLDQSIARAALLPNVAAENQFLYTQGGAGIIANPVKAQQPDLTTMSAPRFITNNAVHEYSNQAVVVETIGPHALNAVSKASASLAIANAELEIAQRGLVATVAGLYYTAATAERRLAVAQRAADEAASLTKLTAQREQGREVAHADVVKAQLLQQQRQRDLSDAKLSAEKARLDLGVLLFPDPRTPYTIVIPDTSIPVPVRADVEASLAKNNPELRSALASSHLADLSVTSARLGYLPDLTLSYNYGIDSPQFSLYNDLGNRNLGYSASAQLNFPLWDWFTTHDKVKQSENNRTAAKVALTNTQRKVIAELEEFYSEATAAHDQLDSLDLSVKTATESLRLVRMAYTAGEATILDVVDAENSLTTTEQAREDGVVRYETALANLQLLTGAL